MLRHRQESPITSPPYDWLKPTRETPLFAYFYPHDPKDKKMANRARKLGRKNLVDETLLVQTATPLFPGHDQPKTFCLDHEGKITTWSDADPSAIARQVELAQEYGINGFIVDAYVQRRNENNISTELRKPLDIFSQQLPGSSTQFCLMSSLRRPRVILPIETDYQEPNRYYELTVETLKAIVDYNSQFWDNPNYFHIDDRPVLGLYGLTSYALRELVKTLPKPAWDNLGEVITLYSIQKYRVHPYLIGVVDSPQLVHHLAPKGFDLITTYAGLVDFYPEIHSSPYKDVLDPKSLSPFQHFNEQLARQIQAWQRISELLIYNFIPSAVVGWDATPRGQRGITLDEVRGKYPFTPIIVDASPDKFYNMLLAIYRYFPTRIINRNRLFTICAFNEITEGAALLPVLKKDGQVDFGYLNALKLFIDNLRTDNLTSPY